MYAFDFITIFSIYDKIADLLPARKKPYFLATT